MGSGGERLRRGLVGRRPLEGPAPAPHHPACAAPANRPPPAAPPPTSPFPERTHTSSPGRLSPCLEAPPHHRTTATAPSPPRPAPPRRESDPRDGSVGRATLQHMLLAGELVLRMHRVRPGG